MHVGHAGFGEADEKDLEEQHISAVRFEAHHKHKSTGPRLILHAVQAVALQQIDGQAIVVVDIDRVDSGSLQVDAIADRVANLVSLGHRVGELGCHLVQAQRQQQSLVVRRQLYGERSVQSRLACLIGLRVAIAVGLRSVAVVVVD